MSDVRPGTSFVAIVAARLDSRRLPGKMLLRIGDRPLFDIVARRARSIHGVAAVVMATTDRAVDDPLAEAAADAGYAIFRGSTDDVAGRLLACARQFDTAYLVRINGDSPFVDAPLIDKGIGLARESGADLVTNIAGRTFPYGVSVEIVRTDTLARAHAAMDAAEREHVTAWFYRPARDAEGVVVRAIRDEPAAFAGARLVVDDRADYDWLCGVHRELGDACFSMRYTELPPHLLRFGIHQAGIS